MDYEHLYTHVYDSLTYVFFASMYQRLGARTRESETKICDVVIFSSVSLISSILLVINIFQTRPSTMEAILRVKEILVRASRLFPTPRDQQVSEYVTTSMTSWFQTPPTFFPINFPLSVDYAILLIVRDVFIIVDCNLHDFLLPQLSKIDLDDNRTNFLFFFSFFFSMRRGKETRRPR